MKCILEIHDEINIRLNGLDLKTRHKVASALKFFVPHAKYTTSYKLGRWDGCISLATTGGRTFLNLLDFKPKGTEDSVLDVVINAGYDIEIDDRRAPISLNFPKIEADEFSNIVWPKDHTNEDEPIILRDYQVDCINKFLENPQCVQEIATAAGKTILIAALSKMCEPYGRTVIIVPNRDLVSQTEDDYKNLGLDVGVFYGGRHEWNKIHTICTWQSLDRLDKKSKKYLSDEQIVEFLDGVICVIVDEVHCAKATVLKRLLTSSFAHCPIRWGLTGTVPQDDFDFVNILASLGPVIHKLPARELQEKNVLANCQVNVLQYIESLLAHQDYHTELRFLLNDKKRMKHIAERIKDIAKTGNTLVLIQHVKPGEQLVEMLPDDSVFIYGGTKTKDRKEEYQSIHMATNKIIVATYGVASVGINIPRIFNLVLIESGKSFVRVIQSIGRGLRRAKDKDYIEIWDFTSTCKFSKRHLTRRKKFYKTAEYPFKITKVDYL